MTTMRVKPLKLNLRSEPRVVPETLVETILSGHLVEVEGDASRNGWKKVTTNINGVSVSGVVSGKYLRTPASESKEKLIAEIMGEWSRFDNGNGKETVDPYYKFVGEMWNRVNFGDLDGRNDDWPWSAAFISFVVSNAGYNNFKFSAAHAKYINQSIVAKNANDVTKDFWGFRLNEHKPELGDMVCFWRKRETKYDDASISDSFPSHADIIVEILDHKVRAIGGNVSNSVSDTLYSLNGDGFLTNEKNLFAIMQNRN